MLSITLESPQQPEVAALFSLSEAYAASLYPPEDRHMVDADFLAGTHVRFLVARWHGKAVGCGALVIGEGGTAEVKRVVVDPAARGQGIGRALMQELETIATAAGIRVIQLETGPDSTEALRLYRACGYRERGPFGSYGPSPHSLFMERQLA
ncbi:MAG TPA: GNAT family N-acetyltransferase [Dongiaceae bacterium]|nr:GNAT family N-acetyltransferase [Dongiaceae bacterium]